MFTHNCTKCVPLGSCVFKSEVYDLWYCTDGRITARYGDDTGDYISNYYDALVKRLATGLESPDYPLLVAVRGLQEFHATTDGKNETIDGDEG